MTSSTSNISNPIITSSSDDAEKDRNITVSIHDSASIKSSWEKISASFNEASKVSLTHDPRWLSVLETGMKHRPYCLLAEQPGQPATPLMLSYMSSPLFGRFLVSLPFLNSSGLSTCDSLVARKLIEAASELADKLDVRYLELRNEQEYTHEKLTATMSSKVHMRLALPDSADELWDSFKPKVRNQIRKGQSHEPEVVWGKQNLLSDFYQVFSRNMRDLGTPVYGKKLFQAIINQFPEEAEFCVLRAAGKPIAAALLTHGSGITEVPCASTLREFNPTNANMLMYWHLLQRAIERNQHTFDFGRSTTDGGTYRFKKQWGAKPCPAIWQYYVRKGTISDMRPEGGKYNRVIDLWKRLPVPVTRLIGPSIVCGIP
ncbi:MAG: GNAT family N-acetyltransferase [Blastopirellula sp.]|nr:MAG: GNAT family N-acetyltransferase [Blastopirellula sp.]